MLRSRIMISLAAACLPFAASAADLELNVSDEAFELRYAAAPSSAGAQVDYGILHQEDDVYIGHLGLHLVDNAGTQRKPVRVGLGGRLVFVETDPASGAALAIGAWARFNIPGADRFAVSGSIYAAPEVTSFADMEKFMQFSIRGEYEVLRNASIYLGYRRVRADFDVTSRSVTLDKGLHLGMKFNF